MLLRQTFLETKVLRLSLVLYVEKKPVVPAVLEKRESQLPGIFYRKFKKVTGDMCVTLLF